MNPGEDMKITVTDNGPYIVTGSIPIAKQTIMTNREGDSIGWLEGESFETRDTYALCRCGQSASKPFCDGTHARVNFDGTETASRLPYLQQATAQEGPLLILTDAQPLCAFARFCDVAGQVWNLVEQPSTEAAELAVREAELCPSGRLVVWDRETKLPVEPEIDPSIGIVEDPGQRVAGPIWVRGGIPVVAGDGETYEIRNRATLCRCGASANKPFCDATHASIGFTD
jgi:CDGSH-type Zn-finger protein